jgi:SPP1 family predicted phage head-tail adaptor
MRAGLLRHPITFYVKQVSRDAIGGEVVSWVTQGQDMAEVTPLTGREYFAALQINPEIQIRFRVRYRADVTTAWRIEWRDQRYDILETVNVDGRDRELELMARTAPS